jgi:hypothetical protein
MPIETTVATTAVETASAALAIKASAVRCWAVCS